VADSSVHKKTEIFTHGNIPKKKKGQKLDEIISRQRDMYMVKIHIYPCITVILLRCKKINGM